jgi:hypothetical protein
MAVDILITGDYRDRDIKRAQGDLDLLKTQSGLTGAAFGGLGKSVAALGGIMAATFSVAAISDFFGSAAAGALADEAAMKSLAISLDNVGQGFRTTGVEQFIDGLARASGTADDILRPALQQLLTVTGNVTTSQGALKLAMDVAAGSSKSVAEVSAALSAAYSGNFTAITRLKTGIDANIIATKDMDKITAALSERYAGQASTAAETYQGRINRVSVAANEASEKIGYALLKALDDVSESFGGTGGVTKAIDGAAETLANFITGLGLAITGLNNFVKAAGSAVGVSDDAGLSLADMAIAAYRLTPGLGLVVQGFEGLSEAGKIANDAAAAQAAKIDVLASRYMGLAAAAATAAAAMEAAKQQKAIDAVGDRYTALARTFEGVSISFTGGNLATYFDELDKGIEGTGGSAAAATPKVYKYAEAIKAAQKATDDGVKSFNDYASSVSDSVTKLVSIDDAATLFQTRNDAVKTALKDLVDYQATLSAEQTDAERKKVTELQAIYQTAQTQAAEGGASIVDTFVKQAERVSEFGAKMRQLLAAGLNETSFKEISAMNLENGIKVADAFLDGNMQENIRRTNEAVGSVKSIADAVGLDAAKQFATAGIQMAVSMIEALLEVIGSKGKGRKALLSMMDDLAAAMNRTSYINVVTTSSGQGGVSPGVTPTMSPVEASNLADFLAGGIGSPEGGFFPGFANGGPVLGGRPIIVGEKGPELFVPGSNGNVVPNNAMGGNSYQITVQAGVGDPRAIGQQIVEYVKKFEQANGPVFRAA